MVIHIDNNSTIRQIQESFSQNFPYLKIEFFSKPHSVGKGSEKRDMKNSSTALRDLRSASSEAEVEINGDMKVSELERMFQEHFGLYVQVFRRSGRLWLETTATDNWTLKYQNEQGKELSNGSLNDNNREEIDYHEQE